MFVSLTLVSLLMGCDKQSDLHDYWSLSSGNVTVLVEREPYSVTIWSEGEQILTTACEEQADGYGPVSWAGGEVTWGDILTPGYQNFEADLDAWQADYQIVGAVEREDSIDLVLVSPANVESYLMTEFAGEELHISHQLTGSRVRVESHLEGNSSVPRAWSVGFTSEPDEAFMGFGERFNRTNQRGVDVYGWSEEGGIGTGEEDIPSELNPYPNGEAMSSIPIPFFISSKGYGFWLDTTWRNEFNLASEEPGLWRAWHIGPEMAYEVYLPISDDERPWPYHLIDQFTEETGRPVFVPMWSLGPRRRIGRSDMVDGVPEIEAMRDYDLAITAVDDATHFLPAAAHNGTESELQEWTAAATSLGYWVNAYFNPYFSVDTDSPIAAEVAIALEEGYFLSNSEGEPSVVGLITGEMLDVYTVDFTSAEATEWYQQWFQEALDLGYSGWMLDFGEYVRPDVVSSAGMTGEELHNYYPVLYQRAVKRFLETSALGADGFYFARSGYTGTSAWAPMIWTGEPAASFEESDGLPSVVRAGINLGVSGIPHSGSDIGGFHCVADGYAAADGELLTRWIQQGSMTSNMQDQNACAGAMDSGEKATIWTSVDAREAWDKYARLHTRLFPYLYTLASVASDTGAPTMRHLFLEHPEHLWLAGVDDTYYLGPSLLVSPVVERGARTKSVPLPPGYYLDWNRLAVIEGGGVIEVEAPLGELPLFVRAGGIIPMLDDSIDTLMSDSDPDVVGPSDVSDVFDVVAFVTSASPRSQITTWSLEDLSVEILGEQAVSDLTLVTDEAELEWCEDCYLVEESNDGLKRLRVSTRRPLVELEGVALRAEANRRIRWDVFIHE